MKQNHEDVAIQVLMADCLNESVLYVEGVGIRKSQGYQGMIWPWQENNVTFIQENSQIAENFQLSSIVPFLYA